MQPKLELLSQSLVDCIIEEAFELMQKPGIKVQSPEARQLLADAGAQVDPTTDVARIPEKLARKALESVPSSFDLYDRAGNKALTFGGDHVHFDPGSCCVHVVDPETLEHRSSTSADLARIVKVTEMLPQYDAQSTAVVCNEVPKEIGDLFRLYIVLKYSNKPIITGSFSIKTLQYMIDMLSIFRNGRKGLAEKPLAVFDACPSPPLIWSNFGAQNLIELARAFVPAEMVPMPLAGATGPVTLLGSVTQHAAESLSGITIHQLAQPEAPIVWGGAPAIFDMRKGTTPMGAVETAMIDASYAQVGKALHVPTHTYLCASDTKLIDAQSGMESGISAVIGALAGINMISGAGMLDFLAAFSVEKLVIDAEGIAMAKRLLEGMVPRTETLATELFEGINFKGDFLKQKATRQLFSKEQVLHSAVIDRGSVRDWQEQGGLDAFGRARVRAQQLVEAYQAPHMTPEQETELSGMVESLAKQAGMDQMPEF